MQQSFFILYIHFFMFLYSFSLSPRGRFVFQTEISGKYIVLVLVSRGCFISFPLLAVGISLPFFCIVSILSGGLSILDILRKSVAQKRATFIF